MKRFLIFFVVIVLCISFSLFPAAAAITPEVDFNKVQDPSNIDGYDYRVTYTNREQVPYFQLWTSTRDDTWGDYIGAFYGESSELNYNDDISSRVRPLSNTSVNIGTGVGSVITDGNYLPISRFPSTTWFFTAMFWVRPSSSASSVLDQYLSGYLYLFYVNSDGVIVGKSGYPINYTQKQLPNNDALFSAEILVDKHDLSTDVVGVVPLFTFYQLSLFNLSSTLIFPSYQYGYYATTQQDITNNQDIIIDQNDTIIGNQDIIINSKPPAADTPINGDFNDMQEIENNIFDSVSSGFDVLDNLRVSALELVGEFGPVLAVCSAIFNLFANLPIISTLLVLSLTLGVFGIIANVFVSALSKGSRTNGSRSNGSRGRGGRSKGG